MRPLRCCEPEECSQLLHRLKQCSVGVCEVCVPDGQTHERLHRRKRRKVIDGGETDGQILQRQRGDRGQIAGESGQRKPVQVRKTGQRRKVCQLIRHAVSTQIA